MVLPSLMTPLSDNSGRGALKPGCLRASSNSGPWRDMDDRPKRHLRHGNAQTWRRRCQLPEFLGQTLYSSPRDVCCLALCRQMLYAPFRAEVSLSGRPAQRKQSCWADPRAQQARKPRYWRADDGQQNLSAGCRLTSHLQRPPVSAADCDPRCQTALRFPGVFLAAWG